MLRWEDPTDPPTPWGRRSGDLPWERVSPNPVPELVRIRSLKRVRDPRSRLSKLSPSIAIFLWIVLGGIGGIALGSREPDELRPPSMTSASANDLGGILARERRMIMRGLWLMELMEESPPR